MNMTFLPTQYGFMAFLLCFMIFIPSHWILMQQKPGEALSMYLCDAVVHYAPGLSLKAVHLGPFGHTTGVWPLMGYCFLGVNNSRMTILQMLVTLTHLQ